MGLTKPIEQYLFSNLLIRMHVFIYLKDIIREGMSMIAFGYEKDNDEEKLMKLSETTLQCNNEELDRIIDFLNRIKNTNYEAGDHYHYRDFNKKWTSEESDFIIFLEEDVESSR